MKKNRKNNPSERLIISFPSILINESFILIHKISAASIANGISFQIMLERAGSARISDETPRIKRILNVLLPTMFPMLKSDAPLSAESKLTINSGALVPNATRVKPTTSDGMPNFFAMEDPPETR